MKLKATGRSLTSLTVPNDLAHMPGPRRHRKVYKTKRRSLFGRGSHSRSFGSSGLPPFEGRERRLFRARSRGGLGQRRTGRRWPKRVLIGSLSLVVVLVVLAVAEYVYVDTKLGDIHREAVSTLTPTKAGQPLDVLLVGSDSRSCDTAAQAAAFGSKTTVTGQRSDTLLVARFLTDGHIEMLSIPRDLWVPIAGTGGSSKINSAFNNGPGPLVATIQHDLHIPINHVVMTNFCGFPRMVNSLGGIYMDFPVPVTDRYTGLRVFHPGCQLVDGLEAFQVVRSRHLYYFEHGHWNYDGMSDFSRIKRQQAFFHALLDRVHTVIPDVFRLNSFLGSLVSSVAVDSGFSANAMLALGWSYHSLSTSNLVTSTLPVSNAVIQGQDALLPVPQDATVIHAFLAGDTKSFAVALGAPHHDAVLTSAPVINNNALQEPWNPYPCSP